MFSGGMFDDNRELDDEAILLLEKRFRRLPMPDYPQWAGYGRVESAQSGTNSLKSTQWPADG